MTERRGDPRSHLVGHAQAPAGEDWAAVATAIATRLVATRMTQMDVASKARVSLTTLRELQHDISPRRRRPQTLSAISEALGWPPDYLGRVLRGENPQQYDHTAGDPTQGSASPPVARLADLDQTIRQLREQVEAEVSAEIQDLRQRVGVLQGQMMELYGRMGLQYPNEHAGRETDAPPAGRTQQRRRHGG